MNSFPSGDHCLPVASSNLFPKFRFYEMSDVRSTKRTMILSVLSPHITDKSLPRQLLNNLAV